MLRVITTAEQGSHLVAARSIPSGTRLLIPGKDAAGRYVEALRCNDGAYAPTWLTKAGSMEQLHEQFTAYLQESMRQSNVQQQDADNCWTSTKTINQGESINKCYGPSWFYFMLVDSALTTRFLPEQRQWFVHMLEKHDDETLRWAEEQPFGKEAISFARRGQSCPQTSLIIGNHTPPTSLAEVKEAKAAVQQGHMRATLRPLTPLASLLLLARGVSSNGFSAGCAGRMSITNAAKTPPPFSS